MTQPLRLADESWGERFHRAYRTARAVHGHTYRSLATHVSTVEPTTAIAIQRLEEHTELPAFPRTRRRAFLVLTAMGFDPADFGLTALNTPLGNRAAHLGRLHPVG